MAGAEDDEAAQSPGSATVHTQPAIPSRTKNRGVSSGLSAEATVILPEGSQRQAVDLTVGRGAPGKKKHRTETGRHKGDSAPPLDFSKNKHIGRFELIREIGRGGMGQVFLGRDTKLGRRVAVKFLLRDDAHFVERFLVEARATARCDHENIVTIYEVGEHEGLPYMVLEYLEGHTLSEMLATKPSVRQFVEMMVAVARALERAHEHGIVHRDLKPSNVFVTYRGQVKVLDFGVARLLDRADGSVARATAAHDVPAMGEVDSSSTFTGANSLVGTLPYMSPEQWNSDEVDHLSDIWAMGIMFWRGLCGAHPAGSLKPERLRERLCDLDTPLPSIATSEPTVPQELAAIVDQCLAKRKTDRCQSARQLVTELQQFLAPSEARTASDICPYRGLSSFAEDDAKYFFGRSNEIRTALAKLESWPLLAVIGPSGVGKSSFVHAGVVPAIRSSGGTWQVRVLRPGRVPLQRLATVLEESLATGELATDLLQHLVEAPGLFGQRLREAAIRHNQQVLVVVDQLEEIFTLCENDDTRKLFLAALLAAADDTSSPIRVVLSMRADFLDRLAGHKQFLAELSRGLFFLTAPDRDNLRETLERPAELAGYGFEDQSVIEDMMQAATSRGALPLLSFAATRLWEARDRTRKLLTRAAYTEMGGVGGAFARHADQVATAVPPQSHILLRAVMTRLVTPEGTRAVVDHRELLSLSTDRHEVERILDMLVQARLIHLQTDPDQGATVEIVHEMLISEWPTLRRWLEDSHAIRGFMHELRLAAKQWVSHGRPHDLVWRGATAQEALAHVNRHVLDLSAVEREFLAAVGDQVRRTRRFRVLATTAVAAVLLLVLSGGSFALVRIKLAERDARDKAQQAELDRRQAEADRAAAIAAKGQLQDKLDIIAAEEKKRRNAEAGKQQVEVEKAKVETQLQQSQQMSRQQLEAANKELQRQVKEARSAKEKALASEAAAQKAKGEAMAAKRVVDAMLKQKADEIERLKKASEGIATSLDRK